jgi:hypothetical protein
MSTQGSPLVAPDLRPRFSGAFAQFVVAAPRSSEGVRLLAPWPFGWGVSDLMGAHGALFSLRSSLASLSGSTRTAITFSLPSVTTPIALPFRLCTKRRGV